MDVGRCAREQSKGIVICKNHEMISFVGGREGG